MGLAQARLNYLLNEATCACVCVCVCVCCSQGRWRLKRFLGLLSGSSAIVVSKSSSGGLADTSVWRGRDGGTEGEEGMEGRKEREGWREREGWKDERRRRDGGMEGEEGREWME